MDDPESLRWKTAGTLLAVAVLLAALGLPLWRRRVPPNPLYGVRIPKAFASESNWYAINERGGSELIGTAASLGGLALGVLVWPPRSDTEATWIIVGGLVILLGAMLFRILRFARRLP